MLESIRSGAQSFGVKVAFGIIILVFVFWGIGNFNDRDYSNVVAMVNGEPILAREFEKAYHNEEEYLLRTNPSLTRQELAKMDLGSRVLNDLIRLTLLQQEAKRVGITVEPLEMKEVIFQEKAFQNENGKFDPEIYRRVLEARRTSPGQYESELATQILGAKMAGLVTAGAWVDPEEAHKFFDFLRERRIVNYLFVPAAKFKADIQISEKEEQEWYDKHKERFSIPARVNIEFVNVVPQALVDSKEISEDQAREWYAANKPKFEKKEEIHARHILVPVSQDADEETVKAARDKIIEIRQGILKGEKFSEAADRINSPGVAARGGDLGWIGRGETVPEFEELAFSLPIGEISEPLRTPFGFHLVIVEEKHEAGTPPFKDVEKEIYKEMAIERGLEKLQDVIDNLIEANILQKSLQEATKGYNLAVEESGLLDKSGLMKKLGLKNEGAEALLAASEGAPLDTALETEEGYLIARVKRSQPAGIRSLEDVRSEVKRILLEEKALKLAFSYGEEELEKCQKESSEELEKQHFQMSPPLERGGNLPDFSSDEKFIQSVFEAKIGSWLKAPHNVNNEQMGPGVIIGKVVEALAPEKGEFEAAREIFDNALKQERRAGVFQIFIENLYKKALPIKINKEIIDRITMQS